MPPVQRLAVLEGALFVSNAKNVAGPQAETRQQKQDRLVANAMRVFERSHEAISRSTSAGGR
jgi:hypothetical protein